jgi:hypothetical protein
MLHSSFLGPFISYEMKISMMNIFFKMTRYHIFGSNVISQTADPSFTITTLKVKTISINELLQDFQIFCEK